MLWIDAIAVYWLTIKLLLYVAGIIIFVSSIDDFLSMSSIGSQGFGRAHLNEKALHYLMLK